MSGDELLVTFFAFIAGPVRWAFWLRQMGVLADRWRDLAAITLTLAIGGVFLLYVLAHAAARDVVDSPEYIFMYLVIGFAWTKLVEPAFPYAGLNPRDDVFERRNAAAVPAVAGALTAVTLCYAGANVGDGPGWWVVVLSAALATGMLMVTWLSLTALSGVGDAVTIDRDPSAGLRLGAFLASCGLVFGRAVAGDWHSLGGTISDALSMIPAALAILLVAAVFERLARPTSSRPTASLFAFGVLPSVIYAAIAIAAVVKAGWPA